MKYSINVSVDTSILWRQSVVTQASHDRATPSQTAMQLLCSPRSDDGTQTIVMTSVQELSALIDSACEYRFYNTYPEAAARVRALLRRVIDLMRRNKDLDVDDFISFTRTLGLADRDSK